MPDNLPTPEEIDFLFHSLDEEKGWKEKLYKPPPTELLQAFPEAKYVIPPQIKEWQQRRDKLERSIEDRLQQIKTINVDDLTKHCLRIILRETLGEEMVKIDQHLARLRHLQNIIRGKKPRDSLTQDQIQQALAVPIQNLMPGRLKKSGRNFVGLCPLHKEKTPSFYIFTANNRYRCFGCQQGGNTINLMRLLYNYDFKEAVKELLNY